MKEKTITKEQALALVGPAMVRFDSYYKYSFTFKGEAEGKPLFLDIGGSSSDIYKFDVSTKAIPAADLVSGWFGNEVTLYEGETLRMHEPY